MRRFKQLAWVVRAGLRTRYPWLLDLVRPIALPIINHARSALQIALAPGIWIVHLPATIRNRLRRQVREFIVGAQIAAKSDQAFIQSFRGAVRFKLSNTAIVLLDRYYARVYRKLHTACLFPILSKEEVRPWSIVCFIGSLGPGGAERQLIFTLRGLLGHGFNDLGVVTLFLETPLENFFRSQIDESIVKVSRLTRILPSGSEQEPLSADDQRFVDLYRRYSGVVPDELREIWFYVRELLHQKPAVFHGWLDDCNVKGGLAAAIVGVPRIILSTRSVAPDHFLLFQPFMREAYRMLAETRSVSILNNSEAGARDYERWLGLPQGAIRVIPNGFDFTGIANAADEQTRAEYRKKLGIPLEADLVGTVIRFSEEKRPLLWAQAAAEVAQRRPETWFLMLGDGPDRAAIDRFVRKNGLSDRFLMPGREVNIPAAMAAMDVFLLTSRMEGLPNVLIEAQAVGTPVVSVSVGGAAETMIPNETGLLASRNDAAELATLVCEALEDPMWRRRASTMSKAHVTHEFNLTRMTRLTLDAYFGASFQEAFPAIVARYGKGLLSRERFNRGVLMCAIGTLGPGGSERQLVNLLQDMAPTRFNRRILLGWHISSSPHDFHAKHLERIGVELIELGRHSNPWQELSVHGTSAIDDAIRELRANLPGSLSETVQCLSLILAHRPFVVHAWLDEINIKVGLAAAIAGVPRIILSTRNLNPKNFELWQPYMQSAYRALLGLPNVTMLNNSTAGARSYEKWLEIENGAVDVVENGFDFDKMPNRSDEISESFKTEYRIPPKVPVVGTIMRLAPEKRPFLWLDMARCIVRQIPEAHFVLVGDGPLRDAITESLKHDPIKPRIRLIGLTKNVVVPLSAMDVFVLTSEGEGLPNVLIEAQSVGVPVVSSDAGGCSETFVPGKTGILITDPTPQNFSDAVCGFLKTPERIEMAGTEASRFVRERFGIAAMTRRTLAHYDNESKIERTSDRKTHAIHDT